MIGKNILTGNTCPISGIWRTEDYGKTAMVIMAGEAMPSYRNKDVSWKMIQHLPKKLSGEKAVERPMIGKKSITGEKCPVSGIWRSESFGKTAVVLKQGEIMPTYRNRDVSWTMIQHLPRQV